MTYEMIDANNTVALLVDHQAGLMLFSGDIDPIHLRNNSVALAKVLALHNIPTVLTAAAFGPQGPLGPIIPEILEQFPVLNRSIALRSIQCTIREFAKRSRKTGRKKVIAAGITADFCIGIPAKTLASEGYDVRLVIDACGNYSNMVLHASIANLTQAGVKVTNWLSVACELQQDWAREREAKGLLEIYQQHLPQWGMLELTQNTWRGLTNQK